MLNRLSSKARAFVEVIVGLAVVGFVATVATQSVYGHIIALICDAILGSVLLYLIWDIRVTMLDMDKKYQ